MHPDGLEAYEASRFGVGRDGALLWAGKFWEHLLCQFSAAVPLLLPALPEASPGVRTEQQIQRIRGKPTHVPGRPLCAGEQSPSFVDHAVTGSHLLELLRLEVCLQAVWNNT